MDWNTFASIATAFGVFIAAWQIRANRNLAQISFEDSLDQQYRDFLQKIPVDALIGKEILSHENRDIREVIFNYLDLCNNQVYLRSNNRVSSKRWNLWCSGIKENIEKHEFQKVWNEIKSKAPDMFSFLEKLEKENYASDPLHWNNQA